MHCVAAAAMPCVPDSHSDSPLPPRATLPFGVMDEDKHIFLCARFRSARNIFSAAARHHLIFERKTLEELLQSIITDLNKYTDIQWDIQREREGWVVAERRRRGNGKSKIWCMMSRRRRVHGAELVVTMAWCVVQASEEEAMAGRKYCVTCPQRQRM